MGESVFPAMLWFQSLRTAGFTFFVLVVKSCLLRFHLLYLQCSHLDLLPGAMARTKIRVRGHGFDFRQAPLEFYNFSMVMSALVGDAR